eukprot:TRINITY_DN45632_c0_g1_i1.p1 TRINITY_DN45632_c0_g1~~TRINITY_DN45632_c0_g1_i1.p1  ORF type:complete len:388 (-),score=59.99 TRINITY_DN45632_c0_g1_i1:274-1437(-)
MGSSESQEAAVHETERTSNPVRRSECGDGNCLFHALARQCLGDPRCASRARSEITDWMEVNLLPSHVHDGSSELIAHHREKIHTTMADIVNIYGEDRLVVEYVTRMKRNGEWGSGLEALCAAYKYRCCVCIWVNEASGAPFEVIRPPRIERRPIGLLHVNGNHWDTMQIPSSWSREGEPPLTPESRPSPSNAAEDRAFLEEEVSQPVRDPARSDDARRAQRDLIAARYEASSKQGVSAKARPKKSGQLAVSVQKAKASAADETAVSASASSASDPQSIAKRLVAAGLTEAQALEALSACDGDVHSVLSLYGLGDKEQAVKSQETDLLATDAKQNKQCVDALKRVGLTESQAVEALTACQGDIQKVKQLYSIDWDPVSCETVQDWHAR